VHATKAWVFTTTPTENAWGRRLNYDVTDSRMIIKVTLGEV
jgi:hypothetical protein